MPKVHLMLAKAMDIDVRIKSLFFQNCGLHVSCMFMVPFVLQLFAFKTVSCMLASQLQSFIP